MEPSASSKVTVEYHDPSGVFPLIASQLQSRLPLRNLHWKAPTRPLRSIETLHIDFVPAPDIIESARPVSVGPRATNSGDNGSRSSSRPPSRSRSDALNSDGPRFPVRERRHQIPGLRQTPYLKILLFRCDDPETYKVAARKQLREWVRSHTPPSQSSSGSASGQENHDAFEWLIIHVVVPDTVASLQPRSSGSSSSSAAAGSERAGGTSKWPGRGSSTIFEKVRQDFNASSKSAPDRVAQIRVQKNELPADFPLPSTALSPASTPYGDGPQEQLNSWNDVIAKLKSLILLSFDQRVSQYEEDIREKDSQRALPGWNFCTFFVLKEGLARGFENVGLVEDALVGYDELAIGLDTILRDQSSGGLEGHGGILLDYTEDLQHQLLKAQAQAQSAEDPSTSSHTQIDLFNQFLERPIESSRKDYRDLIMSNNVSVYEFRCYIFARQMALLLRMGKTTTSSAGPETDDLIILAELCRRAVAFITNLARIVRADLLTGSESIPNSRSSVEGLVEHLTASWIHATASQILAVTGSSALPFTLNNSLPTNPPMDGKSNPSEARTAVHPSRASSLVHRRSSAQFSGGEPPYASTPATSQVIFDQQQSLQTSAPRIPARGPEGLKSGLEDYSASRGELVLLQRRTLEEIGENKDWFVGWRSKLLNQGRSLDDVDLDDDSQQDEKSIKSTDQGIGLAGLYFPSLAKAMRSLSDFRELYESLSYYSLKHFHTAARVQSAERIMGDLAILKFELGDYAGAAVYFSRASPLYAQSRWGFVETAMLKLHVQCLKKLHRKDEYIRVLFRLLAKAAASEKARLLPRPKLKPHTSSLDNAEVVASTIQATWLDDDLVDTQGYLAELVSFSDELPYDVTVPMAHYFADITVIPTIRHFEDKDGFELQVRVRHVLSDDVSIQEAKVLLKASGQRQVPDIWLTSRQPTTVRKGLQSIMVESHINTFGDYTIDQVLLKSNKVVFVHETGSKESASAPLDPPLSTSGHLHSSRRLRVRSYGHADALDANLSLSDFIHIDKTRSIDLAISTRRNEVSTAVIRLKAGTAGLRIHTSDCSILQGPGRLGDVNRSGIIEVSDIPSGGVTKLKIPYELEANPKDIAVSMEISYNTAYGLFVFQTASSLPVELPLDVNVHDIFKASSLLSRFTIRTATGIPLQVLNINLQGSKQYAVQPSSCKITPMIIFSKEPASILYKIKRIDKGRPDSQLLQDHGVKSSPIVLEVDYRRLEEDIFTLAESQFETGLGQSEHARFVRLLLPWFSESFKSRLGRADFDKIAMLKTIPLGSFDEWNWSEVVEALPGAMTRNIYDWLETWHEANPTILLPPVNSLGESALRTRRIAITVTIPRIPVVCTATIALKPNCSDSSSPLTSNQPHIIPIGAPISATVTITATRRWDPAASPLATDPIALVFELDAHPDIWLIGGSRRCAFTVTPPETATFPIVLVALRPGRLLLPRVEVRASGPTDSQSRPAGQADDVSGEPEVVVETDFTGVGEAVVAIPDVGATTVGVGKAEGMHGGVFLVETESREAGLA
ncbi:hypothetical protein P152DRAFT_447886 [Eremomyces bilateralis CBS 781.70]|uniref:TMEM1 family protein-like protein n=1 Tax=Eremomyces bilateralis CBS 781.70 TaxID=1392243 RepID=A0A6G1G8W6_9PEZI|nr:uncharacterized protein P152DRAFT_447886 [Eremomyces bilateralis CBS 781.70]KAF1814545.1 hypothetical protein P152DRAFT_447886 [Eremomyces bilateralis CBS 781.70]